MTNFFHPQFKHSQKDVYLSVKLMKFTIRFYRDDVQNLFEKSFERFWIFLKFKILSTIIIRNFSSYDKIFLISNNFSFIINMIHKVQI